MIAVFNPLTSRSKSKLGWILKLFCHFVLKQINLRCFSIFRMPLLRTNLSMAFNASEGDKSRATAEEIMAILPTSKNLTNGEVYIKKVPLDEYLKKILM